MERLTKEQERMRISRTLSDFLSSEEIRPPFDFDPYDELMETLDKIEELGFHIFMENKAIIISKRVEGKFIQVASSGGEGVSRKRSIYIAIINFLKYYKGEDKHGNND